MMIATPFLYLATIRKESQMPTDISDVATWVLKTPPALLLGAGAAIPSGAPSAAELAEHLGRKIDPTVSLENRTLSEVAEILVAKHGRREVIKCLVDRLKTLHPKGGLLSLPYFTWRAIYSTNYDFLIERAFEEAKIPISIVRSDLDFDKVDDPGMLPLFKLHGCLTQDQALGHTTSMVLTEGDYYKPTNFREQGFNRLQTDIAASGVLIIGHSLRDKHLSDLVRKLADLQESSGYRHRINVVVYDKDDDYALIFESMGVRVCYGGIDELAAALEKANDELPAKAKTANLNGVDFSRKVLSYAQFIVPGDKQGASPDRIYNGRPAGYPDIESGLTFRRDIEDEVGNRIESGSKIVCLVGTAGTGKTTAARRILLEFSKNDIFCWEHYPHIDLDVDFWVDTNDRLKEAGRTGILFVDDITRYQRRANELIHALPSKSSAGLKVLATAEIAQWNPRQKAKEFFEDGGPISLSSLSDAELQSMMQLATEQPSLSRLLDKYFSKVRPENKLGVIRARTEKDMFLALRLLFENESIDNILLSEFDRLTEDSQYIYELVSGLQAAGLTVHRQLALRIMNVPASSVGDSLRELEGLVFEREVSPRDGLFVWETRHPRIAEILSTYKFASDSQIYELLDKAVRNANLSEPLERHFIADLCNRDRGIKSLSDAHDRMVLYQTIIEKDPMSRVARHRLVYELMRLNDLDGADVQIREAENTIHLDPPLQRYKALVALKRARQIADRSSRDAKAAIEKAATLAREGVRLFPDSKYQYLAFKQIAETANEMMGESDLLRESVLLLRGGFRRLLEPELESAANKIEGYLASSIRGAH